MNRRSSDDSKYVLIRTAFRFALLQSDNAYAKRKGSPATHAHF